MSSTNIFSSFPITSPIPVFLLQSFLINYTMQSESAISRTHRPPVIPAPGELPDAKRDAARAFAVLQSGGIIVTPTDVGYGMMATSVEAIERGFAAKGRKLGHTLGIIGTYNLQTKLHDVPPEKSLIVRTLSEELRLTVGVVAKLNESMLPLLPAIDKVTKNGTVAMVIGESEFQRELARLVEEHGLIMVGSSANLSGHGQKFSVQDIEPEVIEAMDLIVDYGCQKWHLYGRASTIIDLDHEKVLRMGANYEVVREKLINWFGWRLPEDPEYAIKGSKFPTLVESKP